jgi:hypothetical protein
MNNEEVSNDTSIYYFHKQTVLGMTRLRQNKANSPANIDKESLNT